MSESKKANAQFWKEDGVFRCILFMEDRPGHQSIEFRAPSWRALKKLMRDHGYEPTTIRERDIKEAWRMPSGDWLATG